MKLFYANGTCAIGIHVLMEETGLTYEAKRLDFASAEQAGPAYLAINPKGKVPALQRDDGSVITEFSAIARWLAAAAPDRKLLPADTDKQVCVQEIIDYVVATIHMQGFSRIVRPENFAPSPSDHPAVKAKGHAIFDKGLEVLATQLGAADYAVGDFSIADAAMFYVEFWAAARLKQVLPAGLDAHYARLKQRPSVQLVLAEHGWPDQAAA